MITLYLLIYIEIYASRKLRKVSGGTLFSVMWHKIRVEGKSCHHNNMHRLKKVHYNIRVNVFVVYFSDTKLEQYDVDESEVTKIATEVAVAKREAEIVSVHSLQRVN